MPIKESEISFEYQEAYRTVVNWFIQQDWTPFDFQIRVWAEYLEGCSGLIHAPTGIGKTYAAWMGPLIEWMANPVEKKSESNEALRLLWITPLRALASDTRAALLKPINDLNIPWTVEIRTGDTPASLRAKQRTKLPTALITTPESLSLLLSYPNSQKRFRKLQALVVDEWHELMGSKRGVMTELATARLRNWNPAMRIWGLSATLGNTDIALQTLLGNRADGGKKVRGLVPKDIEIESLIPDAVERFPWAGHMGLKMLPRVVEKIEQAKSVLVFTNTRSQTEIWYQGILAARPDWAGSMALHHGSVDKKSRRFVEERLRQGRLKCVVCTSSLDLGVDFSPVDRVIQIGSLKGIARLMQRAGRSGHQPGQKSHIVCVPTNSLELIEIAAAGRALAEGSIEPRHPVVLPLDVLCQHLVTIAMGQGFTYAEILQELKTTHSFRNLTQSEFDWVLDFITRGGSTLRAYAEYSKVVKKNGRFVVSSDTIARRHRMNIGTITSDASVTVKFLNGRRLGTVEESFVSRLNPGEVFVFAGNLLQYFKLKDMTLLVKKAKHNRGNIPQWLGGRMPLSTELAAAVRRQLQMARAGRFSSPEMTAVQPLLRIQAKWSRIPDENKLLIEKVKTREGFHIFFYPFEGRLVHEGLAALLAYRISRLKPITITMAVNDYGFELLSDQEIPLQTALAEKLFRTGNLLEDISNSLNLSEMAKRQFREIARVAGLVFQGYPGRQKSTRQVQASSSLLYNVFNRYDSENLLLKQATREVLENQLERHRLTAALTKMADSKIQIVDTNYPTPLAFPILVNRIRAKLSSEKLADRIRKMQLRLEKAADKGRN